MSRLNSLVDWRSAAIAAPVVAATVVGVVLGWFF